MTASTPAQVTPDQGPPEGPQRLTLSRLWVLMVTAFVDMVGFALILPLLPFYALRFGADASIIGVLISVFALAQMISSPFWGRLSDLYGRRPIIIGSQLMAALAYITFAYADSVWLLLLSRFLQGAGGGTISVVSAYVSDSVGPDERAKALGWITACTSAGVMIGPAIASFSVGFSATAPGLIAAGLCGLNLIFAWRWLPERAPRNKKSAARRSVRGQIVEVVRHPLAAVSSLIVVYAAGMMAFMGMNAVLALFLNARFGVTEHNIGWFYAFVGFVSIIMRAVILGKAVQHFGEVRVLRLGALLLGLGMLTAPLSANPWQFLAVITLIPAGTALLFPSTTSLISRYADPDVVGQTLGVQQTFGGVSRLVGPVLAGWVFQHWGESFPFWLAGSLVMLTALFSLRLHPGEARRKGAT